MSRSSDCDVRSTFSSERRAKAEEFDDDDDDDDEAAKWQNSIFFSTVFEKTTTQTHTYSLTSPLPCRKRANSFCVFLLSPELEEGNFSALLKP